MHDDLVMLTELELQGGVIARARGLRSAAIGCMRGTRRIPQICWQSTARAHCAIRWLR